MKIAVSILFAVSVSTGFMALAHAENADRGKSIFIEAAQLRIDDVKQITTALGNVVLTKGSMVVRAEHIEVREDQDGYQFATITGTPQAPPFFHQKREGLDEFIEGEGALIEYDGRADTVRFVRNAVLRRLRGTVLADEITGGLIVYENLLDRFNVEGGPDKTGVASSGGRVHMMLVPRPTASASKSSSAEPSGPLLRASKTLDSLAK